MKFIACRLKLEINENGTGSVTDLARFQYGKWKIDNFEGVTHHEQDRYFLVTDDSESSFQKTLLVYLQILDVESESGN